MRNTACPIVTVIIPFYNVEAYFRECLDSVVNQSYPALEIVCVDDGSTDGSASVLETFMKADSRIRLVRQENRGLGEARNAGFLIATGKYTVFWDSDDYFHRNALEKMVLQAEEKNADVCICDVQQFDSETGRKLPANYLLPYRGNDPFSWRDCPEKIFSGSAVVWNKLYRTDFLKEHELRFSGVRKFEDLDFTLLVLRLAERITQVEEKLVYYRKNRAGSLIYDLTESLEERLVSHMRAWNRLESQDLLDDPALVSGFFRKIAIDNQFMLRQFDRYEDYEEYYRSLFSPESVLCKYPKGTVPAVDRFFENDAAGYLLEDYKAKVQLGNHYRQENEDLRLKLQKAEQTAAAQAEQLKQCKEQLQALTVQQRQTQEALSESKAEVQKLEQVLSSRSYRSGRVVTWLPRKIKRWF